MVLPDDHAQLDAAAPRCTRPAKAAQVVVADAGVAVELVGGPEQARRRRRPSPRPRAGRRPGSTSSAVSPAAVPDDDVLAPLVVGPAVPGRAEDQQLTLARRQLAAVEQDPAEGRPPLQQPGVAGEGGEDVEVAAVSAGDAQAGEQLGGALVALLGWQWRDTEGMGHGRSVTGRRETARMFAGKVAVITGGGSGIGAAMAAELRRQGATVVTADVKGGDVELDVRDRAAVEAAVERVITDHGRLDLLFNNAGISMGGETHRMDPSYFDRIIDVNLRGVVNGVMAAYPRMVEQGHGHIVNTASMAGLAGTPMVAAYSMTKHAGRRPHHEPAARSGAARGEGERPLPRHRRHADPRLPAAGGPPAPAAGDPHRPAVPAGAQAEADLAGAVRRPGAARRGEEQGVDHRPDQRQADVVVRSAVTRRLRAARPLRRPPGPPAPRGHRQRSMTATGRGSEFEGAVVRVLRSLRPGDVVTYGEVAVEAGYPKLSRAVGSLLASGDLRVPWWRVVNSSGRLVPGHEVEQAARLRNEGIEVDEAAGRVRRRRR